VPALSPVNQTNLKLSQQQPAQADRRVFERLLLVVTFILIFGVAARTPLDSDMWWHLSAGEQMLRSGRILTEDIFSFTRSGADWTNPYWLFQIGMALLYRWQGSLALGGLVATLAVISMGLVFLQCQGPGSLKTAALLLASVVASGVWSPRPHLASLVLMALVGYLVYLYKWHNRNVLWALPLVFILWANMHGGYPLGLILIGLVVAGEGLNHLLRIPSEAVMPGRKILMLIVWGILCGFAVLANPNGIRIWLLPFQTVEMQVLQMFIPEWASPDFHDPLQQSLLWLLLVTFAAVSLSGRIIDAGDLLPWLGFAGLALLARRNFGPFALVAAPILARYGAAAFYSWQQRSPWSERLFAGSEPSRSGDRRTARVKRIINLALVGLLWVAALGKLYVVTHPALVNHYTERGYPVQAVEWLAQHRSQERVFNEYNWGGYLQWSRPGSSIFVDGRTDLFNDQVIGEWINVVQAGEGWQDVLDRYQVNLVMLQPDRPLLPDLSKAGWRLLYHDSQAIIYGRE